MDTIYVFCSGNTYNIIISFLVLRGNYIITLNKLKDTIVLE